MTTNYKVGFQEDVVLTKIGKQLWQVEEEVQYYSAITESLITMPSKMKTDLASVPYALQWLLPPDGEYAWEAALHDHLYDLVLAGLMTRSVADSIFKEALSVGKVPYWQEVALYSAVRSFGWYVIWKGVK